MADKRFRVTLRTTKVFIIHSANAEDAKRTASDYVHSDLGIGDWKDELQSVDVETCDAQEIT